MYNCCMTVKINKWGNSLGIRIPKHLAKQAALSSGQEMHISLDAEGRLILSEKKALTLADLLKGVDQTDRHDLFFDNEVGNETWNY